MKNAIGLLLIIMVFNVPLIAQNDGVEKLQDFSNTQQAMLEYDKEDMVKVPGKDVIMAPPEHFEYTDSIEGFFHPGSSTSLQVLEIKNVSMMDVTGSLTSSYFENQGFHLKKDSTLRLNNGNKAKIYITEFSVSNEKYERIFFFTGEENTIWINVNYPSIVRDLIYKPVMSSLKTVKPN